MTGRRDDSLFEEIVRGVVGHVARYHDGCADSVEHHVEMLAGRIDYSLSIDHTPTDGCRLCEERKKRREQER